MPSNSLSSACPVLVALATFNERDNLPSLVDAIFKVLPNVHILVVDDDSPDGTGRWCDERSASEPRLTCHHRPGKLGLGSATIAAMREAIALDYRIIITMDADWSHDPKKIPDLVGRLEDVDVAIGSRYCPGGSITGWPRHRRIISRLVNMASRRLLRLKVYDSSGAFRAYRVGALEQISFDDIRATGYAYLEEILWQLQRSGARFTEVPITFEDRHRGQSKADWREAISKIATIGRLAMTRS